MIAQLGRGNAQRGDHDFNLAAPRVTKPDSSVSARMSLTFALIALNVVVSLVGFNATGAKRDQFVFIPYRFARGQNIVGMLLSHLSHADAGHLIVNMIGLYYFGPVVERRLGSAAFLLIYVLSGVVATTAIFLIRRHDPRFRALGASGSTAGVLFAAIVLQPTMSLFLMFLPVPIPGPIFAVLYIALSSFFMGRQGARVCHEAHVGGALAGLLIAGLLAPHGFAPLIRQISHLLS